MRGIDSMAKAVTPARFRASAFSGLESGARNPTYVCPSRSRATSSELGGATLTTTSAPQGSPIVAPASVNSSSGMRAAWPAPDSTTTSWSLADSFRTTSGTSATRRAPSAVSFGTPIRMRKAREPIPSSRSAALRRADRQALARKRLDGLPGDPHGRLAARARVAHGAVAAHQRAQVGHRRARTVAPHAARIAPRGEEALDRPCGRLRVGGAAAPEREAAVGVLPSCQEPHRPPHGRGPAAAPGGHERLDGRTGLVDAARRPPAQGAEAAVAVLLAGDEARRAPDRPARRRAARGAQGEDPERGVQDLPVEGAVGE